MGKRSEFVGGGLRGICRDRVADLMLPLTGNAAAGGEEERGKRQASEDGPEETDKTQREKKEKTLMSWSVGDEYMMRLKKYTRFSSLINRIE